LIKALTLIDGIKHEIRQERKSMMYLDRGLVGYGASVFYGFISFDARLFGSRHGDRGRTADGTTVFLATPDQPTSTLQTLAMASRLIAAAATTNATTKPTPMIGRWEPRVPLQLFGQRDSFKNKGRRLCPPKAAHRECDFAKTFLAYAGTAGAHDADRYGPIALQPFHERIRHIGLYGMQWKTGNPKTSIE
jgi:hypothetical protein